FAVSYSLLRKVIEYHQCRSTGISEELPFRSTCKWRKELHRRWIRSRSTDNDSVGKSTAFFQSRNDIGNSRCFLTYSHIDTINRLSFVVEFFLIKNSVDGYGSLTGLTVTNDQLPLATPDWNHGIY